MSYANKLKYAGNKPFLHEKERATVTDDMTWHEYENLRDDKTYVRLAQLRWLADELESEGHRYNDMPEETVSALFAAVGDLDSPLHVAVESYVDHWLAEFRGDESEDDDDDDDDDGGRQEPTRSEPADFGGGESTGVQDLL